MTLERRQILVVDDEPVIRDMMIDILELEGYTVQTARDGRDALALLQRSDPTTHFLVFLDLMMPRMDGWTLCLQLATLPALRARLVVVLMSAMDRLSQITDLPVDAIMPKPFVVDDVLRVIDTYNGEQASNV